jgi:hypothetical protein
MRIKGILILIVLTLSIIPPLAINISPSSNEASLFTLDVCHTSNQILSTNSDSPCLFETSFKEIKLEVSNIQEEIEPVLNLFLTDFQIDHPPKV